MGIIKEIDKRILSMLNCIVNSTSTDITLIYLLYIVTKVFMYLINDQTDILGSASKSSKINIYWLCISLLTKDIILIESSL